MVNDGLIRSIKEEMRPALGCTELSVFALGAAKAYEQIGGKLKEIQIIVDPNTYKNSISAGIPGTDVSGPKISALLGVLQGDSNDELEILQDLDKGEIIQAKRRLEDVKIELDKNANQLFADIRVKSSTGKSRVVIKDKHTNIHLIEVDGEVKYEEAEGKEKERSTVSSFDISELVKFVEKVSFEEIKFVLDAIELNKQLSKANFKEKFSLEKGLKMFNSRETKDLASQAESLTANAVGARLTGTPRSAMAIYGSGSHGITATMPIAAIAEGKEIEKAKCARATALSLLITIYIKQLTGRLTSFCGAAVAAGTGASAGITYLEGGRIDEIEDSITNMASDITGIVCDGASIGCALKAATAARSAVRSAGLAMNGFAVPPDTGVVGKNVEKTIDEMVHIVSTDR